MPRLVLAFLAVHLLLTPAALADDDIATLPLGDPERAFLLASGEAGQVIDCRDLSAKGPAEFDKMIADLAAADVVLIGENHTSLDGHKFQWHTFDALVAAATGSTNYGGATPPAGGKVRPVVLGMEFFNTQHDGPLAEYTAGRTDLDQLLKDTHWYAAGNYNFEYYRPLVETARASHQSVRGLNLPRDVVRAFSRGKADTLPADDRQLVGELGPVDQRHKYVVNRMMGDIGAAMPEAFSGMYTGQTVWDSAMAGSILRAIDEAKKTGAPGVRPLVVVIVGSGHVSHGLGIPARLHQRAPGLSVKILAPVSARHPDPDAAVHPGFEPKETAVFSRGYADYVYILPDDDGYQEYPSLGLRLEHPQDTASPTALPLNVASITPGGIADRAGLRKGDALVAINGEQASSLEEAGETLASLRWGQRARLDILRAGAAPSGGSELAINMLVVAPTDGDQDWLKSEVDSSLLDAFDPATTRSYLVDRKFKPALPHARLVRRREKVVRIDVMDGPRLLQTWDIDAAGRPVLGLFAQPAVDGAVRIELRRDEHGSVVEERRLNAGGERLELAAPAGH